MDSACRPYVEEIISQYTAPFKSPLSVFENIANDLATAFEQQIMFENYIAKYKGGNNYSNNRLCAIYASIDSYFRCFNEMPTSSEDSKFTKYISVLYELIGMYEEIEDGKDKKNKIINIKEHSLYKDIKISINKFKSNIKHWKNKS